MKTLPAPDVLIRAWLHDPHAITVAAFAISGAIFSVAAWQIQRNLRHNEPGLRAPVALPLALIISAAGIFGASRLPSSLQYGCSQYTSCVSAAADVHMRIAAPDSGAGPMSQLSIHQLIFFGVIMGGASVVTPRA